MTLLRQSLASPRTRRFYRRYRAFARGAGGRTRKPIFIPRLTALEDRTLLATLVVDQTGAGGAFTTIQAAVNAASPAGGDIIQIHPATYTEQVTIGKSLTMMGTAPDVVIQAPPTLTPDPLGLTALVEINNSATVDMSDLTVQGPVPQAVVLNAGILIVGGATANVTNSTIAHIRDNPPTGVGNTGSAIAIGGRRGSGQLGTATITNDIITDYQKTGILVRGGATATITGNTISGGGPTSVIAHNGIQVDLGATATITGNTVTGNEYTNSTPDPTDTNQATGILIDNFAPFLAGGTITVSNNTIGGTAAGAGNDLGISSMDPEITVEISGNTLQGNRFEGVELNDGTATVSNNNISGSNIGVAVVASSGDTADATGNLTGNQITNNGQVSGLSFPGAGILLFNATGATTKAVGNLLSNNVTGNGSASVPSPGILIQSSSSTTPLLTANFNRIVGNSVGVANTTTAAVDATLNWWGSNTGPNTSGSDTTTGTAVNTNPWLVLNISASPATIGAGATAVVTADLTKDSNGATHSTAPFFPDQIPITFSATGGTVAPASVPTVSGMASSNFTSSMPGTASASATLDNQTVTTPPITIQSMPTVTGLSPTSGPAAGGTLVTITGTGFTGATAVDFGTTAATNVAVVNDTTITATSPAGTGVVAVTVTTPTGTSATSAADQFTFVAAAAPTVTGVSPTTGSAAGGTSVTITGTGFTGATAVNFGTVPAKSFTVVNDTTINAVSPAATGAVNVTVVTPNGTSPGSAAAQFTFAAAPPTVASLVRFGFHMQQTSLVLTFSTALNPTPAQDVNNYQILAMNGTAIPISSAVYDPATLTVTLVPSELLSLHTFYQLTVNGATPNGLTSSTGVPLDGKGNGTPGTNFVSMFGGGILVGPAPATLSAQPKRFAAEKKQLAADEKKWAAEVKKANALKKHAAFAAKKLAATEKKLATQLERANGPSASAVDELSALGALIARPNAIRVQIGHHQPRG